MTARWIAVALGATFLGTLGSALAQPYGGPGYGRGYEDRGRGYDDRGGYEDRRPRRRGYDEDDGYEGRQAGFDAREYLRCNPDVRRAVDRGQMESAERHYQEFGRRERRRLTC